MQDFGTKADDTAGPSGQLSASEFNNLATELENSVLRSGQALSSSSDTQMAQSMFLHGVKSASFQDSGLANAYVATPISGSGGVLLPATYDALNGAVISFKASNANTGAATLNIGQTTGTLLGSKPIRTSTDTALGSGDIKAGQYVQVSYNSTFNSGTGAWELLPWSAVSGRIIGSPRVFTSTQVYTETPGTKAIIVRVVGGGGSGGPAPATGASQTSVGSGGGAGGHAESYLTSGFSGVTITIGAGGVGTTSAGASGGTTSFGSLLSASGGQPGLASSVNSGTVEVQKAGNGGTGSSGNRINALGGNGHAGVITAISNRIAGAGGDSVISGGGAPPSASGNGGQGSNGSGGAGSFNEASQAAKAGGIGGTGVAIITELS